MRWQADCWMAAWGRSPALGRMLLLPACMAPRPLQLRLGKLLWVCRFAAGRRFYKWIASLLNAFIALAPSANVQPRVARMKSGERRRQSYPQCLAQVSRLPARANARLLATAERSLRREQCHGRIGRCAAYPGISADIVRRVGRAAIRFSPPRSADVGGLKSTRPLARPELRVLQAHRAPSADTAVVARCCLAA